MGLLAQFLLRLAFGLAVGMAITSSRQVTSGFYRNHLYVTLGLATLGYVHVPSAPVEAVIALSIVFVASEILRIRRGERGLTERAPWLVAGTFGLLHGFGFAGALSQVGLPANDIPLALLFFNLGVEAGQLAFVVVVLGVIALVRNSKFTFPRWTEFFPPYAIGGVAMFWVIERTVAIW